MTVGDALIASSGTEQRGAGVFPHFAAMAKMGLDRGHGNLSAPNVTGEPPLLAEGDRRLGSDQSDHSKCIPPLSSSGDVQPGGGKLCLAAWVPP